MIKLLQLLRRHFYWTLDLIKGNRIKKNYDEIKKILENKDFDQAMTIGRTNLTNLIDHSTSTTPYYKKYSNTKELENFPVINKNIVLDNYDDFKSKSFLNKKLYKASSSGSTGIPFSIYHNKEKRNRSTADAIYFLEKSGGKIGNKLYYFKLWDYTNHKNRFIRFFQNIEMHSVMKTTDLDIFRLVSKIENSNSDSTFLGYPSFYEEICKFLDRSNYMPKNGKVKSIISMSEGLKEYERNGMSIYFKAPIFERYSNEENGILAQQTYNSNESYILNWASYYIEVLNFDSDKHVKSGDLGRIVITDLFNYSMPLIRYDTGDTAIYLEKENGFPTFEKIYGRRMDIVFNTNGEVISPFIFYRILEFGNIKQFQFIQEKENQYLFKINGNSKEFSEKGATIFFKEYLGENALLNFEYVKEIPLLSSGKRKKVVNLINRNN